jgi:hypothetical protein
VLYILVKVFVWDVTSTYFAAKAHYEKKSEEE